MIGMSGLSSLLCRESCQKESWVSVGPEELGEARAGLPHTGQRQPADTGRCRVSRLFGARLV